MCTFIVFFLFKAVFTNTVQRLDWYHKEFTCLPLVDSIWAMMIVWKVSRKIIRTVLCCIVYCSMLYCEPWLCLPMNSSLLAFWRVFVRFVWCLTNTVREPKGRYRWCWHVVNVWWFILSRWFCVVAIPMCSSLSKAELATLSAQLRYQTFSVCPSFLVYLPIGFFLGEKQLLVHLHTIYTVYRSVSVVSCIKVAWQYSMSCSVLILIV